MFNSKKIPQLSVFQLKMFALISMTLDHIYVILGSLMPIPAIFNYIGRLSAPIFVFSLCEGLKHTKNRKAYLLRLYLFSVLMGMTVQIMNFLSPPGIRFDGNILATFFLIAVIVYSAERAATKNLSGDVWGALSGICGIIAPLFLQILFSYLTVSIGYFQHHILFSLIPVFIPLPFEVEGGIYFIILGVALYFAGENRRRLILLYTIFSLMFLLPSFKAAFGVRQWAMIFALPIMLLYNGSRGRSMKYFFYLYYPIHIIVLMAAAGLLAAIRL